MEKSRWRNQGTTQALTIFIHHQFGDIASLYLRLLGGNVVGHHGQAEGAGDGASVQEAELSSQTKGGFKHQFKYEQKEVLEVQVKLRQVKKNPTG